MNPKVVSLGEKKKNQQNWARPRHKEVKTQNTKARKWKYSHILQK